MIRLVINAGIGQPVTITAKTLQEKLGLGTDIVSLGIEVSDDMTAIIAQAYPNWICATDTIDVNVKSGGKEMQAAMFQLPTPEIPAPSCRLYDEQGHDEEDWFAAASFAPRAEGDDSKHPVFVDDRFGEPVSASGVALNSKKDFPQCFSDMKLSDFLGDNEGNR